MEVWNLILELVDRLVARDVEGRLYIIGGVAAALRYYPEGVERRLTDDIDAVFSPEAEIQEELDSMARERGLHPDWLNNKARTFLPPTGHPEGELIYREGNVSVRVAPARLILAMKLRAARLGRDDEDIAVLLRHCGVNSMAEADALVYETYDGEEEIPPARRAIVEATFGEYELSRTSPPITLPPIVEIGI